MCACISAIRVSASLVLTCDAALKTSSKSSGSPMPTLLPDTDAVTDAPGSSCEEWALSTACCASSLADCKILT